MKGAKTSAIRLATALIPFKGLRRRVRRSLMAKEREARLAKALPQVRARYAAHAARCRGKLAAGERLKVVFLVCDASMFSSESVYLAMKDDPRFDCSIAVAPRTARGEEFLRSTQEKAVALLSSRYGADVRAVYDPDTGRVDPPDADLVFTSILYEDQSLECCTVESLSRRSLAAIVYYGYGGLFRSNESKTPFLPNAVLSWRFYVSNAATRDMLVRANPALDGTVFASGYCKMDRLAAAMADAPRGGRPRILVCPHHTIDPAQDGALAISSFLENADALLELPAMFPEADFTFRPHPLLFVRLATPKWWGRERADAYLAKMAAHPNVEVQMGGDYFETFARSDALLNDCGSFLAEYFYTGRPQCFMMKGDGSAEGQFLPFARRLLGHVRTARGRGEIAAFVRDVVEGRDPGREEREAFARAEVCVNHPRASCVVVSDAMERIADFAIMSAC